MIETIQDPQFTQLTTIGHAFFTRKGGVSDEYYHSLNCSIECLDNKEKVLENRRRAMNYLNFQLDALITVKNVHGNTVKILEQPWTEAQKPEADAIVTKLDSVVLASDSADCPIVLFADEQEGIIALAHAGWKGAKLGILENTVEQMVLIGAKTHNICAVISPCIKQNSYEVSSDFYEQFLLQESINHKYFVRGERENHYLFDLLNFVHDKLLGMHLKSVSAIGLDTYANEELFFSFRRSCHKGEPDYGGHFSCIYFKK